MKTVSGYFQLEVTKLNQEWLATGKGSVLLVHGVEKWGFRDPDVGWALLCG